MKQEETRVDKLKRYWNYLKQDVQTSDFPLGKSNLANVCNDVSDMFEAFETDMNNRFKQLNEELKQVI